jgi:hypothetical protein
MDIHYRLMKLLYSESLFPWDMKMHLDKVPLLFGCCLSQGP